MPKQFSLPVYSVHVMRQETIFASSWYQSGGNVWPKGAPLLELERKAIWGVCMGTVNV